LHTAINAADLAAARARNGRQVARLAAHLKLDHALVTEVVTDELTGALMPGTTGRLGAS